MCNRGDGSGVKVIRGPSSYNSTSRRWTSDGSCNHPCSCTTELCYLMDMNATSTSTSTSTP
jgi:hypothetical protein